MTVVAVGVLLTAGCTGGDAASAETAARTSESSAASPVSAPPTPASPVSASPTSGVFNDADTTVRELGAVPIPTPGPTGIQPLATPGHLQLVAMGDTVVARPKAGTSLGIVAFGPDLTIPPGPARPGASAKGFITVTVRVTQGSVTVRPQDFVAHDVYTHLTKLRTTAKPTVVRAGQTRQLTFTGTFLSGGAVFEWLPAGKRLVVWDFQVEID